MVVSVGRDGPRVLYIAAAKYLKIRVFFYECLVFTTIKMR